MCVCVLLSNCFQLQRVAVNCALSRYRAIQIQIQIQVCMCKFVFRFCKRCLLLFISFKVQKRKSDSPNLYSNTNDVAYIYATRYRIPTTNSIPCSAKNPPLWATNATNIFICFLSHLHTRSSNFDFRFRKTALLQCCNVAMLHDSSNALCTLHKVYSLLPLHFSFHFTFIYNFPFRFSLYLFGITTHIRTHAVTQLIFPKGIIVVSNQL